MKLLSLVLALAATGLSSFNFICYMRVFFHKPRWGAGILALLSLLTLTFGVYFLIVWNVVYSGYTVPMWIRETWRAWGLSLITIVALVQALLVVLKPERQEG
jgi:hypothetical protein